MPEALSCEWIEYLDWELSEWVKAIMGALPMAGSLGRMPAGGANGVIKLTDPQQIAGFFDGLNASGKA